MAGVRAPAVSANTPHGAWDLQEKPDARPSAGQPGASVVALVLPSGKRSFGEPSLSHLDDMRTSCEARDSLNPSHFTPPSPVPLTQIQAQIR